MGYNSGKTMPCLILLLSLLSLVMFQVVISSVHPSTNDSSTQGNKSILTRENYIPTKKYLARVSYILDKCNNDTYYSHKPMLTMRSGILHFLRKRSGNYLMWQTIAMGAVANTVVN